MENVENILFSIGVIWMRERIISSAKEQIQKYGFRRFAIGDITSDLRISSKTVYKYFSGKDDIISAVCTSFVETEKEKILKILTAEGTWLDKMTAFISEEPAKNEQLAFELKKHFPAEWKKVMDMQSFLSQHKRNFMEQGVASGNIRPDIDLDMLEIIMPACIDALFNIDTSDLSTKQVLKEFWKVVMYGILTPESKMRKK